MYVAGVEEKAPPAKSTKSDIILSHLLPKIHPLPIFTISVCKKSPNKSVFSNLISKIRGRWKVSGGCKGIGGLGGDSSELDGGVSLLPAVNRKGFGTERVRPQLKVLVGLVRSLARSAPVPVYGFGGAPFPVT